MSSPLAGAVMRMAEETRIPDPGASGNIAPDRTPCSVSLRTATAETRTVSNPTRANQVLLLAMAVDTGDCVVTFASAFDQAGNTAITFNDTGDEALFVSIEKTPGVYAWRCVATDGTTGAGLNATTTLTAATITTLTTDSIIRTGYTRVLTRAHAKVGATSGWVIPTTTDLPYMATMAASQTGGTLVVHLDGLHIGDTITGYKIIAQVESAGNVVTIDAALRAVTNVAAEPTDAAIGTGMTQVSVTADTAVASAKTGHTEVVTSGKTYYLLLVATTNGSTDIILQNIELTVTTA